MPWFLSDRLGEYAASAAGLLRGRPARNTILLGAAERQPRPRRWPPRTGPSLGVNGDAPAAAAFAAAWQELTGDAVRVDMKSRLYRLGQLRLPHPPPPGQARVAAKEDHRLLLAWSAAFHDEAQAGGPPDVSLMVDDRLSCGGFTLWETGGEPVSMAG